LALITFPLKANKGACNFRLGLGLPSFD